MATLQPPLQDHTIDAKGQLSQAWARHQQDIVDELDTINAKAGVVDGSDAAAGQIGEYLTASGAAYPGALMASGVLTNIATLPLTPGDWDVSGQVGFVPAAATKQTVAIAGVSLTSLLVTAPPTGIFAQVQATFNVGGAQQALPTGTLRVNVSVATPVYLVANSAFTVSTLTAFGTISARRMR